MRLIVAMGIIRTAGFTAALLAVMIVSTKASDVNEASNIGVRGGAAKPERIPLLQRIYGPENSKVRAAIHELETESTHYRRTGVLSDPTHEVDYHDMHPLKNNRRLAEEEKENYFEPMRITFVTDALDERRSISNAKQIDFVKEKVLDRMGAFWSEALNVVPVADGKPLKIAAGELISSLYCGHSEFTKVPSDHMTNGVANTDMILYVSASPSAQFCGPSTLAVAVACNFDQFDRPTAGAINFCLDQIDLDSDGTTHESIVEDNVDVAIHEAAHVFGMSSNTYKYFWDAEADPPAVRTSRPFKSKTVTCVDEVQRQVNIPDTNTLQFLTAKNGQRSAVIVTPKVQTVVRNHFNCMDLEGAQLENQPTGSNSCTGDHWDERLFYPESLSGVISPTSVTLSPLTLALFEDSGWYSANYTKAIIMPWGHGAGCDFVREACLIKDGTVTTVPDYGRGYFCSDSSERGCSPSQFYKMGCNLMDYSVYVDSPDPPERFQYFQKESLGGMKQVDYCPVFGSVYRSNAHELDCRDPDNDGIGFYGEVYGSNSTCYESSSGTGRCYESACDVQNRKLRVRVNLEWKFCDYDFQKIDVAADALDATLSSVITCPRLTSVCPNLFCLNNCGGRGNCDWNNEDENGTVTPICKCFDPEDISVACSESLPLDGKYIQDESGLLNNTRKKFFDPLVSVFTDNPDEWETESWIWASALLVVFLLLMLCVCSTFWPKKKNKGRGQVRSDEYGSSPRGNPRRGPPRDRDDYAPRRKARPMRGEY